MQLAGAIADAAASSSSRSSSSSERGKSGSVELGGGEVGGGGVGEGGGASEGARAEVTANGVRRVKHGWCARRAADGGKPRAEDGETTFCTRGCGGRRRDRSGTGQDHGSPAPGGLWLSSGSSLIGKQGETR